MNQNIKYRKRIRFSSIFIVLMLSLTQCEIQENYEYQYGNPGGKLNQTAWEFIQQTDILSTMEEAVGIAGMEDYYSGSTAYTFIIPRNSAFANYLKANKYTALSDIPVETLRDILKYHLVKERVIFSDPALIMSDNPIAYETVSGQKMYLSHNGNYQGLINQGTKKSWTIITSNLEPTNGVIHITSEIVYLSE